LLSIRSVRAEYRAPFASVARQLRRHRAVTRVLVAALALAVATVVSAGGGARAGLAATLAAPTSILPTAIGQGIGSTAPVAVTFDQPMDPASVVASLSVTPEQPVQMRWSDDGRTVWLSPATRWQTDRRYVVAVPADALRADGLAVGSVQRFSFTTQTAPRIVDIGLSFMPVKPGLPEMQVEGATSVASRTLADTASQVSAGTSIRVAFSSPMNRDEVERGFSIYPSVPGVFSWSGTTLTFSPTERLVPDTRYAVSLIGVHDAAGNPLAGDPSFSFTTRSGAQVVKVDPGIGASGVSPTDISLWFSLPVDAHSVAAALSVRDVTRDSAISGTLEWNSTATQVRFVPDRAFAAGHRYEVALLAGAADLDGNAVEISYSFTTKPAVVVRRVTLPPTPSSPTLVGYALNQVNTARAAYGLPPLVLDAALSATASAHAWDMINNGYFSHNSLDGTSYKQRLTNAGISYGWSGENICSTGRAGTAGLDWCHATFMAEPYPGYANHIGNILGAHYHKIGIGIAESGGRLVAVWDFTD
jgi:hypothetical protein